MRAEYIGYKNNFKNYIERSAQFKPILDCDVTLNRVILKQVKCSFFYKCLTYHKRKDFSWNKQRAYWENIFNKTYDDAEWDQIVNSLRDIRNNNYQKQTSLMLTNEQIYLETTLVPRDNFRSPN